MRHAPRPSRSCARTSRDRRDLVQEKVDVVVYGIPDFSPYAAFSHLNPILTLISTGLGYLGGVIEAFGKPGCTVILATPCRNEWHRQHHASYPEVWERVLPETHDPYEARKRFENEFATRQDYIDAYRHNNAFHGVHGIMAIFPLKRLKHAARVFVAGAEDPSKYRATSASSPSRPSRTPWPRRSASMDRTQRSRVSATPQQ